MRPLPNEVAPSPAEPLSGERFGSVRAMATEITIRVPNGEGDPVIAWALEGALGEFENVGTACTRFDPTSPLMRANASPERWHRVPRTCFEAIASAHSAYTRTRGMFDPRILRDLASLGYDRSLPFLQGEVTLDRPAAPRRADLGPWRPRFRGASNEVLLGGHPIDLGGIGKGLALRSAAARLAVVVPDFLIEAGGDCWCSGRAQGGDLWRIGVEDPFGGDRPVAVLELRDQACTTSSIRIRRWKVAGRNFHHILDPRTGQPGGTGLLSVTVIGRDPAESEVWSKVLLLEGAAGVGRAAERRHLAALWVTSEGELRSSRAATRYVLWKA